MGMGHSQIKAKLCVGRCKALRRRMQSVAWADAKLCVGGCKALRWHMQCFAWTVAMLCVWDGKNWLTEIVDFW